jgi:hypothetical protein
VCTSADACKDGKCVGTAKTCNDSDPCTVDACDPKLGCTTAAGNDGATCSDGLPCTLGDACKAGSCAGTGKNCADGNTCTLDTCDGATGNCANPLATDGTPCDDGNACSPSDTCAGGVCKGVGPVCDDKNPCTVDSCATGNTCKYTPVTDGTGCDDGSLCTTGDACAAGQCNGKPAIACADTNPCTVDTCAPTTGKCVFTAQANGAPCDDGKKCTAPDTCVSGTCSGGAKCDDKNPCTTDTCNATTGACTNTMLSSGMACDDGNACTTNDKCNNGQCMGGAKPCNDGNACTVDTCQTSTGNCLTSPAVEGTTCSDNQACTTGDACKAGKCVGVAKVCNDGNPCTFDSCDGNSGACVGQKLGNGAGCDDGVPCTVADQCAGGKCAGAAKVCDDGNPCTTEVCEPSTGNCVATPVVDGKACNDGDACTVADACTKSACKGAAKSCDDNNPCTADVCGPATGNCLNVATANGLPCGSGVGACAGLSLCSQGVCVPAVAGSCEDGNPCTNDACDQASGKCVNKAVADGSACVGVDPCVLGATCSGGVCGNGTAKSCDDNAACTVDTCDKAGNCVYAVATNGLPCNDNQVCTGPDQCTDGSCLGEALNCSDNNPCTLDWCDFVAGCKHAKGQDLLPCNDGNACTKPDVCQSGVCFGSNPGCDDGLACTTDGCGPNGCLNTTAADGAPCADDNLCTGNDVCVAGKCAGGPALNCNDGNSCTLDFCDNFFGCKHTGTNNNLACDDNSVCTTYEVCLGGSCQGGEKKQCDDKLPCTVDSCDPVKGCVAVPGNSGAPCDDGSVCTPSDACSFGNCTGKNVCEDGNPCTMDDCSGSVTGACTHKSNPGACDDGNPCTTGETCATGKCTGGKTTACDDGNPCTSDACNPATGQCAASPVADGAACNDNNACTANDGCKAGVCQGSSQGQAGQACSDGNECTVGDTCDAGGKCVGGALNSCNDGNLCTTDACDALAKKCTNTANALPCDDKDACTKEACAGGKCVATPVSCDDGQACTADACEPTSGCSNQPIAAGQPCNDGDGCTAGETCQAAGQGLTCTGGKPTDCGDGNACTADDCSQSLGCIAKDPSCNDFNPCTTDACTATGCTHKLGTCAAKALTYTVAFECGDKTWLLSTPLKGANGSTSGVGWGTDALPNPPNFISPPCSLNYNDGTGYTGHTWGTATSIYSFNPGAQAKVIKLSFNNWDDVRADNAVDQRWIELSTDNFNTVAASKQLDNLGPKKAWTFTTVELSGIGAKPFQLRFRFDSMNKQTDPSRKGWFIEDLNLSAQ